MCYAWTSQPTVKLSLTLTPLPLPLPPAAPVHTRSRAHLRSAFTESHAGNGGGVGVSFLLWDNVLNHDLRPAIPEQCPPRLATLLKRCWHKDRHARPDFEEVVETLRDPNLYEADLTCLSL